MKRKMTDTGETIVGTLITAVLLLGDSLAATYLDMIIVEIDRCRQFITIEGIIMLEALLLQQEEVPPVEDPHLHISTGVHRHTIIDVEVLRGRRVPVAVGATLDRGLARLQDAAVVPTVQTAIPLVPGPTNRLSPHVPRAKNRTSKTMLWQTIF